MKTLHLPYGKTGITVDLPQKNLLGIYESNVPEAATDPSAEVRRAMDEAAIRLEDLAKDRKTAVIIASDHTRPVPSKIIMPEILRRLRTGSPEIRITILIATGCHRETSWEELVEKFGQEIADRETIVVHDSTDESSLVTLGMLPSGGILRINRLAVEADLLVSEGFIEPHFFAGFSGGRKSVLPGIAARETVLANHCSGFIQSPFARTGNLEGNPIHKDMLFAAKKANLAYIVNVVLNGEKKIVRAFAGDMEQAHAEGCAFLRSCCKITVPEADIVLTTNGGYPLDQNVYQSVKGMTAAEAVCREGGTIILAAECSDGHGGKAFFEVLSGPETPEDLWRKIAEIPRDRTTPDQWQYQILLRILRRFKVIFVTHPDNHEIIRAMKMTPAATVEDALQTAFADQGKNATVAVIPDGVSVIAGKA